ncbi:hypothetical protein GLE_3242 [Lysobacter enzymogenes]|uniref:Uncharacterized protein n=1 Tax=Lysobacter enzymogenes TaxID=69 RepID=A0A0S2DJ81_LYSEN|nr:hypothetical protein GLE_3242 [Lysobacter enzymogenes]
MPLTVGAGGWARASGACATQRRADARDGRGRRGGGGGWGKTDRRRRGASAMRAAVGGREGYGVGIVRLAHRWRG